MFDDAFVFIVCIEGSSEKRKGRTSSIGCTVLIVSSEVISSCIRGEI